MAGAALLAGGKASAEPDQCTIDSASLTYGTVSSLRSGWQPGVGEVVIRCRNDSSVRRDYSIIVELTFADALDNVVDPNGPSLKLRLFEDPGYRLRWGGGGRSGYGKAVDLSVSGMSEGLARVPVYAMIFVSTAATAGEYRQDIGVAIHFDD